MPRVRQFALVVLACAACLAAGCGSNNKGKIVGKWRIDELANADPKKAELMKALGMYGYLEFHPDGTLVVGVDSDKKGLMEIAKLGNPNLKTSAQTTYKLLSGNAVEIADTQGLGTDAKKIIAGGRGHVVIEGDKMTLTTSDDKVVKLTRMHDAPTTKPDEKPTN